jgi:hypothetical protein
MDRREATFPAALVSVADQVEARILRLLDAEIARWAAVEPALVEPLDELRLLVGAGGKRLRPAFCHCAFVGSGGTDPAAVIDAAAALELVHTFALVHDDIMDGSDFRRGRDAVHRRFARQHEDASWRGPARRFGDGMAILVGDFALVYADILLRGAPADAQAIFDELRVELCVGQSLDLVGTATARTDAAMARRIATYKSGKYTVERPLHLGAALAGRYADGIKVQVSAPPEDGEANRAVIEVLADHVKDVTPFDRMLLGVGHLVRQAILALGRRLNLLFGTPVCVGVDVPRLHRRLNRLFLWVIRDFEEL